jgi:hypothetical protein
VQPESVGHATVRSDYRLGELHDTAQVCWRDADRLRILLRVKAASDGRQTLFLPRRLSAEDVHLSSLCQVSDVIFVPLRVQRNLFPLSSFGDTLIGILGNSLKSIRFFIEGD